MDETELGSVAPPAYDKAAFTCPHCNAHTQQQWYKIYGDLLKLGETPFHPDPEKVRQIIDSAEDDDKPDMELYAKSLLASFPETYREQSNSYLNSTFLNFFVSRCFICRKTAVWLAGRLIYPTATLSIKPNVDLPPDVANDFVEAAQIAHLSPRGAAAILRLAIEKLCRHLGKEGKIDSMIADLVADGLPEKVLKALDVVRVVGNESVHPGTIDVSDDPDTVQSLFRLVNIIAENTITEKRHVDELFRALPPAKLKGIEQRNARALAAPQANKPDTE